MSRLSTIPESPHISNENDMEADGAGANGVDDTDRLFVEVINPDALIGHDDEMVNPDALIGHNDEMRSIRNPVKKFPQLDPALLSQVQLQRPETAGSEHQDQFGFAPNLRGPSASRVSKSHASGHGQSITFAVYANH